VSQPREFSSVRLGRKKDALLITSAVVFLYYNVKVTLTNSNEGASLCFVWCVLFSLGLFVPSGWKIWMRIQKGILYCIYSI